MRGRSSLDSSLTDIDNVKRWVLQCYKLVEENNEGSQDKEMTCIAVFDFSYRPIWVTVCKSKGVV